MVGDRREREQQRFAPAGRREQLLASIVQTQARIVVPDRVEELGETLGRTVGDVGLIEGLQPLQDFAGGGDVRLADVELEHVASTPPSLDGKRCEPAYRRCRLRCGAAR